MATSETRTPIHSDPDLEALAASQERVAEHLGGVRKVLAVGKAIVRAVDMRRINKRLGRDLPKAGRAAAQTVRLCAQPFEGTGITVQGTLAKVRRVEELAAGKAALDSASAEVGEELSRAVADLATDTETVLDIVLAVRANPATDRSLLGRLIDAAAGLLSIVEQRSETKRQSAAGTRALKTRMQDTQADVTRLKLENKILSGDKLHPDDVTEAAPLAARGGRRKPGRGRTTKEE